MTSRIRNIILTAALVAPVGLGVAACGGSAPSAKVATQTQPATPARVVAQSDGPAVVAIITAGQTRFDTEKAITSSSAAYAGMSKVIYSVAAQLLALTYPPNAQADARTYIDDLNTYAGNMSFVSQLAASDPTVAMTMLPNVATEASAAHADGLALCHDLGVTDPG